MSDIDKIPPNCHDCPYWEIAESPYLCFRCEEIMRHMQNEHRITQAACLVKVDGIPEPQVIPLHRHSDLGMILKAFGFRPHQGYKVIAQGFLDNEGTFYNRWDAYTLAKAWGQKVPEGKTELFSEDLY